MAKYLKCEVPRYCDNQIQFVILLNMWHLDNITFFLVSQTCHIKEVGLYVLLCIDTHLKCKKPHVLL